LTRGYRTAIPRHRTLRAALDWSYEILPPTEQAALRGLSVFVGSFEAADAGTVIGGEVGEIATVTNLLAELAAKSLLNVRVGADQVDYQLPATVRAYALEKLHNSPERRSRILTVVRPRVVREARRSPPALPGWTVNLQRRSV